MEAKEKGSGAFFVELIHSMGQKLRELDSSWPSGARFGVTGRGGGAGSDGGGRGPGDAAEGVGWLNRMDAPAPKTHSFHQVSSAVAISQFKTFLIFSKCYF